MTADHIQLYKKASKKVVNKLIDDLARLLKEGDVPDLYWKLEKAIFEALKWAHKQGDEEAKTKYLQLLKDFESKDGTSNN